MGEVIIISFLGKVSLIDNEQNKRMNEFKF